LKTLIMRNLTEGKHFRISVPKDRPVRIGDRVYGWDSCCVVVKILEAKKKEQELRGTHPKGVIFSEYAAPTDLSTNVMRSISKWIVTKNNRISDIEKMVLKRKLKEFHTRPYLKTVIKEVKGKPQGEEDISKARFPFYCTFNDHVSGQTMAGQVNRGVYDNRIQYRLVHIGRQYNFSNTAGTSFVLSSLMKRFDIEICKGETKVWKEAGEYKRKE